MLLCVTERTNRHITLHPVQDIDVSKNIISCELGLSRPTPLKNATLERAMHMNGADHPRRQVHITSIPVSHHTCNVQESMPASHHGPSHTVQTVVKRNMNMNMVICLIMITVRLQQRSRYCARKQQVLQKTPCGIHLQVMVATTCGRKHKPPFYTTQEDRLTDQC